MIYRISRAAILAAELHAGQQRSGWHPVPYIEHPIRVAERIRLAAKGAVAVENLPVELFEAALLHDVIEEGEDPAIARRDIVDTCGIDVLALVEGLTDDPRWPREHRMSEQACRVEYGHSPLLAIVKLADKLDNVVSMRESRLPAARAIRYCDGAAIVGAACWRRIAIGRAHV